LQIVRKFTFGFETDDCKQHKFGQRNSLDLEPINSDRMSKIISRRLKRRLKRLVQTLFFRIAGLCSVDSQEKTPDNAFEMR